MIACYAIRSSHAFIYLRGEVVPVLRRLHEAVREAYEAGYLGKNILGSGLDLELTVHAGAGAYICGEETALLDSLEGRRGQPRLRPPFPAVAGLYACPTVVNNVESIASVPAILQPGQGMVQVDGQREVPGLHALLAQRPRRQPRPVRGPARHHPAPAARHERRHAARPPAEVLDAGRLLHPDVHRRAPRRARWTTRAWAPPVRCSAPRRCSASTRPPAWCGPSPAGPSSTPTSPAASARPCREGTYWLVQLLRDIEAGKGRMTDLDKLNDIADNINGKSFCALGDGAASPDLLLAQVLPRGVRAAHHGQGLPLRPGQVDRLGRQARTEVNA